MKTSCKFHRIPGTQARVITKVHDLLGQPSYMFEACHTVRCINYTVSCINCVNKVKEKKVFKLFCKLFGLFDA